MRLFAVPSSSPLSATVMFGSRGCSARSCGVSVSEVAARDRNPFLLRGLTRYQPRRHIFSLFFFGGVAALSRFRSCSFLFLLFVFPRRSCIQREGVACSVSRRSCGWLGLGIGVARRGSPRSFVI